MEAAAVNNRQRCESMRSRRLHRCFAALEVADLTHLVRRMSKAENRLLARLGESIECDGLHRRHALTMKEEWNAWVRAPWASSSGTMTAHFLVNDRLNNGHVHLRISGQTCDFGCNLGPMKK